MNRDELKTVIKEAIQESFLLYGFTVNEPNEVQQDMLHLRNLRLGCEATKRNIIKAFITVTVPASVYLIWEAIKGELIK